MSLLVETIKVQDGIPVNLEFHNERFIRSVRELYGRIIVIDLKEIIKIPSYACEGTFRCRVEYAPDIRKIEFLPYRKKMVRSLKIIENDRIEYSHKYVDRSQISELLAACGAEDDFLLIKNGLITDTSYANIVFKNEKNEWFTPSSYLLPGTKRAGLLRKGIIKETKITADDIRKYTEARLINALIDIDDSQGIPVSQIHF